MGIDDGSAPACLPTMLSAFAYDRHSRLREQWIATEGDAHTAKSARSCRSAEVGVAWFLTFSRGRPAPGQDHDGYRHQHEDDTGQDGSGHLDGRPEPDPQETGEQEAKSHDGRKE
jgi:hypothetical protein